MLELLIKETTALLQNRDYDDKDNMAHGDKFLIAHLTKVAKTKQETQKAAAADSLVNAVNFDEDDEEALMWNKGIGMKRKAETVTAAVATPARGEVMGPLMLRIPGAGVSALGQADTLASRIKAACEKELHLWDIQQSKDDLGINPLIWFNSFEAMAESKYPILRRIARRYLGIKSNAAFQERIFSIAGKLYGKDRNRLSPGIVDAIIFLFINVELATFMPKKI